MPFRFPIFIVFSLILLLGNKEFFFGNQVLSASIDFNLESFPNEKISVRESTVDLQISVGEKIFVFGKAKGTLDKVKVGMHVLPFSQVPGAQGNESTFTKVSWKKLKDGSIQIQSFYTPWPHTLTWTVLANGELKMEALATQQNLTDGEWLGLGFNYPKHQLYQISWKGDKQHNHPDQGHWKNKNFISLADSGQGIGNDPDSFFQQIQSIKLEFESVIVDIRTENPDVYFRLGGAENQDPSSPVINSDLGFLFSQPSIKMDLHPQFPSENNQFKSPVPLNPLVLWFHFQ